MSKTRIEFGDESSIFSSTVPRVPYLYRPPGTILFSLFLIYLASTNLTRRQPHQISRGGDAQNLRLRGQPRPQLTLVAKTPGDTLAMVSALREEMALLNSNLPIFGQNRAFASAPASI
jgi:hypothetical protein